MRAEGQVVKVPVPRAVQRGGPECAELEGDTGRRRAEVANAAVGEQDEPRAEEIYARGRAR